MTAADTLTGAELVEVVQSGGNKKATVNDLLPVQLQEGKTMDVNGHFLNISGTTGQFLSIDPTTDAETSAIIAKGSQQNSGRFVANSTPTTGTFYAKADFNDGTKTALIQGYANATETEVSYNADKHLFPDIIPLDFLNDGAAASNGVDIGQLYHTAGVIKIRLS